MLDSWESIRDTGIPPQFVSVLDSTREYRREFLTGASALGLVDGRKTLKPQQLLLADALNVGNRFNGVLMPRRSTKTTSLLAWAIGRCFNREDYMVAYTVMTTGKKARDRFLKDVAPIMEKMFPDKRGRPFTLRYAAGQERIEFTNGSMFQILAPKGDDFRSDAFDLIILDEAGEAEPDMGDDVTSAALPTMDTRPGSLLVVAGTAAKFRTGNILWDELEDGRGGKPRHSIVSFEADQDTDLADLEEWDNVEPIIRSIHPGIDTLTTIEAIHDNFDSFTRDQFAREYMGIFGKPGGGSFLSYAGFLDAGATGVMPAPPDHFRLGFAVHPLGISASIVAAWRVEGKACGGVIEAKAGTKWLVPKLLELARKYRMAAIAYDGGQSVNNSEADKLNRARPKPKLDTLQWNQISTGAATLTADIQAGAIIHWNNAELNEAVRLAVKRGTKDSKRWSFGRGANEENDITPLEAWAAALKSYDEARPRTPLKLITGD